MLNFLRRYRWVLKGAVSVGLLGWLLSGTDMSAILAAISGAHPGWVAFALAMNLTGMILSSLRWKVLLSTKGNRIPLLRLYLSYLVAMFFNNFLPSTIGGDAMRAYDSWRYGGDKSSAVAVVLVDRGLGLGVMLVFVIASALALFGPGAIRDYLATYAPPGAILAAVVTLAAIALALLFLAPVRARAAALLARLPLAGKILSLLRAIRAFLHHPLQLAVALALSFVLQAFVILYYYVIAHALGLSVPPLYFAMVIPLILIIMMVPISINGIGVRENAFAFFFGAWGMAQSEAIALAWIAYGLVLFQGVIGGIIYALRRH